MKSIFQELSHADIEKIKSRAVKRKYRAGESVFSEGDAAEYFYLIDSGLISIFIDKFNSRKEIQTLGIGEFFGEMAVFYNGKRTASASAKEDAELLGIAKQAFLDMIQTDQDIARKIYGILSIRNEELVLKEKLIDATGLAERNLHIGIKGDPSLRESALTRDRHESVVDSVLPELIVCLEDLLLNRSAYRVFIGFNSGEIRISSILDPFTEEFHSAQKLLDGAYLERHFPLIRFEDKIETVRRLYKAIHQDVFFGLLPGHLQNVFGQYYENWQPVSPHDISRTIRHLPLLRGIPNYYVRNTTISLIQDAIHMQFNCDGAYIVSADDYERFLEENL
ncbi:MAG: cyclic nucleotide-binding domain-containing protein [Sulfuricellaceae bacterium]|nr:cyclic nucleotide-binding domain-containing protein [Sulfuricellaceae bacterium]